MPATTYQVTIGDHVVRVRVRHQGERIFVRLDDADEHPASLATVHGSLHSLLVGDQRTELLGALGNAGATLAIGGLQIRAEVLDEAHARLASVAGGRASGHVRRELKAPMPGLLVNVLCQTGDTIEPGQPLVILQAMKMENELSLPRGGTVISVAVQAGQTIEQGQVLMVVE